MKLQISVSVSVIATSVMLVSCASKGKPTRVASAAASSQDETSSEYRKLAANAEKRIVCRRQAVTGSLIPNVVCLTPEQMQEQRENALKVMRDIEETQEMARSMADPSPPPTSPRGTP